MSEPVLRQELELTPAPERIPLVPSGDALALDQAYIARQNSRDEERWRQLIGEGNAAGEPTQPGVTPADQPSAVATGAKAGLQAVGEGAQSFMAGLTKFLLHGAPAPEDVGSGVVKEVASGLAGKGAAVKEMFDGLMGVLSSPGTAVGAGLEQALTNLSPERAKAEVFPGGPGGMGPLLRAAAGGTLDDASPMTLGEVANLVGALATPAMAGRVKKGLPAGMRALGEQRGTLGPGPEPASASGAKPPRAATATEPGSAGAQPPPGEVRVNLARIGATESVKNTIANINALNSERLAASRATKTHEQTIAGSRGAMSVEDVLALPEGHPVTEEQVTAIRDLRDAAAAHVDQLVKRVLNGEAETGLIEAFLLAGEIEAKRETSVRTAARVLEAQKIPSSAERAAFDMARVAELAAALADVTTDGIDEHVLANRLAALRTETAKRSYAGTVGRYLWTGYQNVVDLLHWAFVQSLLSNPVSHAANILGTAGLAAYHLPERFVAGAINDLFVRNPEGVHMAEAWAAAKGYAEGAYTDSLRMMGRAIQGEEVFGNRGSYEGHFDLKARVFGLDPDNLPGKAIEIAGMLQPTRLMGTEDAFFKGLHYRAELKALAVREVIAEGLDAVDAGPRTADLEAHPTAAMLAEAKDAALLRTLNAELGPAGQAVMRAANLTPGARFIAPFIRTPTNIGKAVWQRAPVLNLLSAQNWRDMAAGGARRDMAMARIALGSAVGAAVAWQVMQGNITGAGPSNRNLQRDQREDGLPQYSIRVGEEWFTYSRLDPVGMYLGTIATALESASQVPDPETHWTEVAFAATTAAGKAMLDKTWATGVRDVLDAVTAPDRQAKKIAMGWARAIVPAGVRQLARTGLPGVIEPHPEVRELRDFSDAILSGLPDITPLATTLHLPSDLPSVLDVPPRLHPITGEPMTYPAGWGPDLISPIYVTRRKHDPVLDEIVSNEISVAVLPQVISGSTPPQVRTTAEKASEGVKLTKEEYLRLQVLATKGGDAGERGGVDLGALRGQPSLYDRLLTLIASSEYQTQLTPGPEGSRADRIRTIINLYREAARGQLQRESPLLEQAIRDRQELRLRQKVPANRQPLPGPSTGPASLDYLSRTLAR